MSVVNKMLRDLDRRQRDPDQPVFAQHVGVPASQSKWPIVFACAIAAAVTAGVIFYVQKPAHESAVSSSPITAADTAPIQPTPVIVADATPAAAVVAEKPPEPETPAPPPVPARPTEIVPPLQQAAVERPKRVAPPPVVAAAPVETTPAPVAAPAPAATTTSKPAPIPDARPAQIDVRPSTLSAQTADGEYRRAIVLINQARTTEARAALATALKLDPRHESARQTLAVLMVDQGENEAAEALLAEGLRLVPTQSNFAMVLARLKVERGDSASALQILRQFGPIATDNAQYRGFAAALLQRAGSHADAITEYRAALALVPDHSLWWIGLGMSYEATDQRREAAEAYGRARASGNLTADLAEFVERKLQTLR